MRNEQRGQFLRKIIGQIRERNYPYEERSKKEMNWSDYDSAQCREIVDIINTIRDVVDEAASRIASRKEPSKPGPGRPPNEPADIVKVLMLQSYFGIPNRPAEGLLILFSDRLGIRSDFSYKTIERGYDRQGVKEILDEVFKLTNEQIQGFETDFSVDGSGSSTSNKQNYRQDRETQRRKGSSEQGRWAESHRPDLRDYQYHLGIIGVHSKIFSAWITTSNHHIGELGLFPAAMKMAAGNQPSMESLLGDGNFAGRPACNIIDEYGVDPIFMPKRNSTFKRLGSDAYVRMCGKLLKNPQQYLSKFHMRSISETGFSMVMSANPQPLRKRLSARKGTEDYLRAICHNVKQLCYLRYLWELDVDFVRTRPVA
jgi:transposase